MKRMKWLFVVLSALLLLAACSSGGSGGAVSTSSASGGSGGGSGNQPEKIVLRAANDFARTQTTGKALDKFVEEVANLSGGKVEIQAFHDAQLGTQKDGIEKTLAKTVEMVEAGNSGLAQFGINAISVSEMPYLFSSFEAFEKAVTDPKVRSLIEKDIESRGLKLIAYRYFGPRHTLTKNPARTFEDFENVKLRAPEFEITIELMQAWGSKPVIIPLPEIYSSIQSGVVDGFEGPVTTILSNKTYEVAKYLSLTNHIFYPGYLVMNKEIFDSLSKEVQDILLQAGKASEEYQLQLAREEDTNGLEELKKLGVEIISYPSMEPFEQAGAQVRAKLSPKLTPEAQELLKALEEVVQK